LVDWWIDLLVEGLMGLASPGFYTNFAKLKSCLFSTIPLSTMDKLAAYKKLIAANPKKELKGATIPYTSYHGHMFSYFQKDGRFGLRLPVKAREDFIKKYKKRYLYHTVLYKKNSYLCRMTVNGLMG
jgi:hypothetical protein